MDQHKASKVLCQLERRHVFDLVVLADSNLVRDLDFPVVWDGFTCRLGILYRLDVRNIVRIDFECLEKARFGHCSVGGSAKAQGSIVVQTGIGTADELEVSKAEEYRCHTLWTVRGVNVHFEISDSVCVLLASVLRERQLTFKDVLASVDKFLPLTCIIVTLREAPTH